MIVCVCVLSCAGQYLVFVHYEYEDYCFWLVYLLYSHLDILCVTQLCSVSVHSSQTHAGCGSCDTNPGIKLLNEEAKNKQMLQDAGAMKINITKQHLLAVVEFFLHRHRYIIHTFELNGLLWDMEIHGNQWVSLRWDGVVFFPWLTLLRDITSQRAWVTHIYIYIFLYICIYSNM